MTVMGCHKCAQRRRTENRAQLHVQTARKKAERVTAQRTYDLASAWHRWGWNFIHRFTMAIPPGGLDNKTLRHVRRVVQLFVEVLPCKDCRGHATKFLAGGPRPRLGRIKTGQALVLLVFELHNDVNRRTHKPQASLGVLQAYQQVKLRENYNNYLDAVKREPPVPVAALAAFERHMSALGL